MIVQTSRPEIWPKLRFHPVHSRLWTHSGRFACVVAGRQSGKTEICQRKLILQLPLKKPWPDPTYYFILPTNLQARQQRWYKIIALIPPKWIVKDGINKSEMSITTVFGSKLFILGADKPYRLEGNTADFIMIDESSDQRPGLFTTTILPMLAARAGRCYRLGKPKRSGIGKAEFKEFFYKGLDGDNEIESFHWKSAEVWSPQEIALQKSLMTEIEYAQECEATWIDQGGTVYYSFSTDNVRDDIYYDPALPIVVGCDFNVDPMCWVLAHRRDSKLYIFDEVFLRNTNTQKTLDFIINKYYQHNAGWRFFGDASGRNKHTSAIKSDYYTLKNDARLGQHKVIFPNRNPHVRDRIAAVNKAFKTADGKIHAYVSNKCKRLINDLNVVSYIEGKSDIEDYRGTDIAHTSDALGYVIHALMPVKLESNFVPAIWSTG